MKVEYYIWKTSHPVTKPEEAIRSCMLSIIPEKGELAPKKGEYLESEIV